VKDDGTKVFNPDWIEPPGTTIADLLTERGWTQVEFSRRIDYAPKHVNLLIKGRAAITEETALRLERVIGGTVGFWLNREARYREALTRQSENNSLINEQAQRIQSNYPEFPDSSKAKANPEKK